MSSLCGHRCHYICPSNKLSPLILLNYVMFIDARIIWFCANSIKDYAPPNPPPSPVTVRTAASGGKYNRVIMDLLSALQWGPRQTIVILITGRSMPASSRTPRRTKWHTAFITYNHAPGACHTYQHCLYQMPALTSILGTWPNVWLYHQFTWCTLSSLSIIVEYEANFHPLTRNL